MRCRVTKKCSSQCTVLFRKCTNYLCKIPGPSWPVLPEFLHVRNQKEQNCKPAVQLIVNTAALIWTEKVQISYVPSDVSAQSRCQLFCEKVRSVHAHAASTSRRILTPGWENSHPGVSLLVALMASAVPSWTVLSTTVSTHT